MSGGANIVEQYAGADVPARIELLIKYYPNFNMKQARILPPPQVAR